MAFAFALSLTPTLAQAQFNKDEQKCRGALAKEVGKMVKTAGKAIGKCYADRLAGKREATDDCYDTIVADAGKGKIGKGTEKIVTALDKNCPAEKAQSVVDRFFTCSAECITSESLSTPLADDQEIADCLTCEVLNAVETASAAALGLPDPASFTDDKDSQKCAKFVQKGYQKYLDDFLKNQQKCQKDNDKKLGENDIALCSGVDLKGKAAKSLEKADGFITKFCGAPADLVTLGVCGADIASLQTCAAAEFLAAKDLAYATGYGDSPCPNGIVSTIRAGQGSAGATGTVLNVGWTGVAHNLDLPDDYEIAADITCPGLGEGSCGSCTIDGLSTRSDQYSNFARCAQDTSIECTNPFGNDPACPSGGECGYYLGGPLAISAGGTFTCSQNRLREDITGTSDPDNGTGILNINLLSKVHTGEVQQQPCPICEGDTTAQDGNRDGTCTGGAQDGQPCDVHALDASFGDVSLDCPSSATENISGTGLVINLELTTGSTSLGFDVKCDGALNTLDCACGQCVGALSQPCNSDAECVAVGGTTCTSNGGGAAADRVPNQCGDTVCNDDISQTDRGSCSGAGPFDKFCDGLTRANGGGVLACITTADCETFEGGAGDVCPGNDCGECTVIETRTCFLDPILLSGTPDVDNPIVVGTFCVPPTNNGGVNLAAGTPGPAAIRIDMLTEKLF
ncbi:MAG: hypothetical protein ACI91F_000349 [Candidatus Binatia bacterium]|jgi:hypothetical protein